MNKFQLILSVLQASLNLEQFVISETFDILNEVTSTNSLNNYTHVNRGVQHYCAMAQKIGVPQSFSASHNSVCRRQVTTRTAFKHTTNEINSAKNATTTKIQDQHNKLNHKYSPKAFTLHIVTMH